MKTDNACQKFLKLLGRTALVFLVVTAVPCHAATTLTLAHVYPPEHPTAKACQRFADTVTLRSQRRILIKLYDEASMGHQTPILQSMKNGSLDLAVLSQGSLSAIVPEFNALGLPYLFRNPATAWRVLDGAIGQQLVQKLAANGFVVLSFLDIEIRQLSNSVRPVMKPVDLVGLRIRTPPDPLAAEVISAMGGTPQEINFSDLYKALKLGAVDGQENPLSNFEIYKFYEVQKYLSLTGHKYSIYALLIGKSAWDALTATDREMVRMAALEAARYQQELTKNADAEAYRMLMARGVRIDKVDTKPFAAVTASIYDKWYASPIGDFVRAVVAQAAQGEQ